MEYKTKPKLICVVCGKEIYCNGSSKYYPGKVRSKSKSSITCSHDCSIIYQRIYKYASSKITFYLNKKKNKQIGRLKKKMHKRHLGLLAGEFITLDMWEEDINKAFEGVII